MDQTKGNFTTQINRDKRPGDSRPVYTGRLTPPGSEEEYAFSLFVGKTKDGKRYFSGPISRQPSNGSFEAEMDALMAPDTAVDAPESDTRDYRLFLLESQFSAAPGEENRRPQLWGRARLGADEAEIQISVWEKPSRYQINPHITKYLAGETQYPLEREALAPAAEAPAVSGVRKPKPERSGR